MNSDAVKIEFKFPKLAEALRAHATRIYLSVAASMQTNRGLLFDAEGGRNGQEKWAPLKFRNGQILSDTGNLRRSLSPPGISQGKPILQQGTVLSVAGGEVTIGSSLPYARLMNDGTTKMPGGELPLPDGKKVHWIKLPAGKNATPEAKNLRSGKTGAPIVKWKGETWLLAKHVRIPARPFDQIMPDDKAEFEETYVNTIAQVLNEATT